MNRLGHLLGRAFLIVVGEETSMKAWGPIRIAAVLILPIAVAVFALLAKTLGPSREPGRRPRPGDPGLRVYVLEEGGAVRLHRLDTGGRPRLVPIGPAVRYEPGDRRPR
jgi:hypothetical protein